MGHTEEFRRDVENFLGCAVSLVLGIAALIAFLWFVFVRPVGPVDGCPPIDERLNAYERELQQRECEARQSKR